jgi:hypothetical protein
MPPKDRKMWEPLSASIRELRSLSLSALFSGFLGALVLHSTFEFADQSWLNWN